MLHSPPFAWLGLLAVGDNDRRRKRCKDTTMKAKERRKVRE